MLNRFFRQDAYITSRLLAFLMVSYIMCGAFGQVHAILGIVGLNVPNMLQLIITSTFLYRFGAALERKISPRVFFSLLGASVAVNPLLFLLFGQSWNYVLGLGPLCLLQATAIGHQHVFGAAPLMNNAGGSTSFGAFSSLRSRHLPFLVVALVVVLFLLSLASGVCCVGVVVLTTPVSLIACNVLLGRSAEARGLPIPVGGMSGPGPSSSSSTVLPGSTEEEAKQRRAIAQAALAKHLEQLARTSQGPAVTTSVGGSSGATASSSLSFSMAVTGTSTGTTAAIHTNSTTVNSRGGALSPPPAPAPALVSTSPTPPTSRTPAPPSGVVPRITSPPMAREGETEYER